jgi:hypothetical protein
VAAALRYNGRLTSLDMSFNQMSPQAAVVFANSLSFYSKKLQRYCPWPLEIPTKRPGAMLCINSDQG